MNKIFLLLFMIFCHIVDDFRLQGIKASMKQKSWWIDQIPTEYKDTFNKSMYKNDYIMALIMHSFSWSFMINLPIMIYSNFKLWIAGSIIVNMIIHAIIDDLKANKLKINLIMDQTIHIIQIFITFIIFICI